MKVNIYKLNNMSPAEVAQLLRRSEIDIESLHETVRPIIQDVKEKGDAAIIEYNAKFDKASMTASQLKASEEEFAKARETLDPSVKEVIEISAKNIRKYHEAQMPEEMWFTQIDKGILAGEKITPITSAGLYVPRGKSAFPSVMLMLGIPAVIAKVPELIILCYETVDPAIAALDLLIEAEHGPDSCALLVTHSEELAAKVEALLPDLINDLPEERNYR